MRNPNRKRLQADDVLAGRGHRPSARELIELIRDVNPSGLDLPAPEAAWRYALKSRLQSLLIRRFDAELEVEPDRRAEGVVSLRHRLLATDACHAVISELDEDARSWAQRQLDLQALAPADGGGVLSRKPPARSTSTSSEPAHATEPTLAELLRAGQDAIDAYDYDLARDQLARAFDETAGSAEAALPLLTFLVDHLAADQEALTLEARLAPAAQQVAEIRRLLALAAARIAERDRALSLLEGQRDPAAADVYIALARAALDAGDLAHAARDLTQAQQLCPAHASIADLVAAVAERRAHERRPLEDDLARLVAERRLDEAEACGQALLARFADSVAARKALREIEELRAAGRSRDLVGSAEQALARGEAALAHSLFHKALAMGLGGEQAARVRQRLAQIEAAERAAAQHAQQQRVVRLLGDADLTPGLLAYIALETPLRSRVRKQVRLMHLEWLDAMAVEGSGAQARAAAAAVLALDRADKIVEAEPALALELLAAHAKLLEGVDRSEEVAAAARHHLEVLAREQASRRLDAARDALHAGAADRARELLAGVPLGQLPDRELATELHAQIEHTLTLQRIERSFRDGALLRARRDADDLLARTPGEQRSRLCAIRLEIGTAIQKAFHVKVDPTVRPCRSLRDIEPRWIAGAARALLPDTGALLLAESRGVWVFLRVVDLASCTIRQRITLRTPSPLILLGPEIDQGRAILIGHFGSVLELSLTDWTVLEWHERLGFETDAAPPDGTAERSKAFDLLHLELVRDAALAPGTRLLWLAGNIGTRWFVRVVDLTRGRVLRDFHESLGNTGVQAVRGLDKTYMGVVRRGDSSFTLYEPHGAPVDGSRIPCEAIPKAIVAYPGQHKILLFTGTQDRKGTHGGGPTPVRWCTLTPSGDVSPEQVLLEEVFSAEELATAVDTATGRVFIRVAGGDGKSELIGLQASRTGPPSLVQLFRIAMPDHAAMIQGWPGQGVVVLAASEGGVDVMHLGAEPPRFRKGPKAADIGASCLHLWGFQCDRPTGARNAAVLALSAAIRSELRPVWREWIEQAKRDNNVERLLEIGYALKQAGEPEEAGTLMTWIEAKYPDHPEARVGDAHLRATLQQWSDVRQLLASGDPSSLNDGSARHWYHLLATAHVALGEPDEALQALKKGASFEQGRCDLSTLMALCTPLPSSPGDPDDSQAWNAEQALIRTLMRAMQEADACLERGDASGARKLMDRWEVLQGLEVQSLARLAQAWLLEEQAVEEEQFDKAFALASFCAMHAERKQLERRELPLPRGQWDEARLDELWERATRWLDTHVGGAWSTPPGGL